MRRVCFIVALAVVAGALQPMASAAERRKVTLADAVKWAVERRGDLKAAKLAVEVAQQQNNQVVARFMPVITGNASANVGLAGSFQGLGLVGLSMSPYKRLIGGSLDGVWEVFDFGRTIADSVAQGHEIGAARYQAADMERVVRFRAADLYLRCLAYRKASELARKHHETAEEGARIAEAHSKAQLIATADADVATLQVLQAHREMRAAEQAEHACTVMLGGYIGTKYDLDLVDVKDKAGRPPVGESKLVDRARTRRPDLKAMREKADAWDSRATAAGLDHLPRIRAVGSLGWALLDRQAAKLILETDLNHAFYAVGVGVQVPIFEGGKVHAKMRENQARRDAQRARTTDLERKITAQVRAAVNAWKVAWDQLQRTTSEADRAAKVEATARKRWKAGLSNIHAWTMARTMAFRSSIAHQTARYQLLRARNALRFAVAETAK